MGGRGPAPKDPVKRRRTNVEPMPRTVVSDDGELRGPDLPDGYDWPEQTRRWWDTWRTAPQAQALSATDWDFLLDTALLHAALWSGNASAAPELRLRVAKFGATPEDRARLRMQIDAPDGAKKPAPKPEVGGRYGHLRSVKPA